MVWRPSPRGAPLPGDAWVAFTPGDAAVYALGEPVEGLGDPMVVPTSTTIWTTDGIAVAIPDQSGVALWSAAPDCATWPVPSEFSHIVVDDGIASFRASFQIEAAQADTLLGAALSNHYRGLIGQDLDGVTPTSWEGVLALVYAQPGRWVFVQFAPKFGTDVGGQSLWVSLDLAMAGTGHAREDR